jgi:tRNA (guanine6-N2)-methyltransferase
LATRAWRVCNFEGALNAAVAQAMVQLTQPKRDDLFLNMACGSGTLLIERWSAGPARQIIGCDIDPLALTCARQNVAASSARERITLRLADARALPLADHCITALAADLPFGHLVGSHGENVRTYPLILQEAARVARRGARFAVITHEVRLMEQLLGAVDSRWDMESALRVELGGLFPRIYILVRK